MSDNPTRDHKAGDIEQERSLRQTAEETLAEVLDDKRRLAKLLDTALHGEEFAAEQASLCDLIEPARMLKADRDRLTARVAEVEAELLATYTAKQNAENDLADVRGQKERLIAERDEFLRQRNDNWNALNTANDAYAAVSSENDGLRQQLIIHHTDDITGRWSPECAKAVRELEERFDVELISSKHHGEWVERCDGFEAETRTLRQQVDKWKRRAKLFQEAYNKKDFEAFALKLQKMQLESLGTDATLIKQRDSMKAKYIEVCRERNALRQQAADIGERVTAIKVAIGLTLNDIESDTFQIGRLKDAYQMIVDVAALVPANAAEGKSNG